jgi:NAD-dependent dihydropyrimidine dehydrogenase PreA subunit
MNITGLQIDKDACTLCSLCVRFCPVQALEIPAEEFQAKA